MVGLVFLVLQIPIQQQGLDHGIGVDQGLGVKNRISGNHLHVVQGQLLAEHAQGSAGKTAVLVLTMHQQNLHVQFAVFLGFGILFLLGCAASGMVAGQRPGQCSVEHAETP